MAKTVQNIKNPEPHAEQRATGRLEVRKGEGIHAKIRLPGRSAPLRLRVVDYSALGFGVISGNHAVFAETTEGTAVRLELAIYRKTFHFDCAITSKALLPDGHLRLGLRRLDSPDATKKPELGEVRRGKQKLLILPRDLEIPGLIGHPFLYDQRSVIRVTALSRRLFVARSTDRSFVVFPDMEVSFHLNVFFGAEPVMGRVAWIEESAGGLEFGIHIDDLPALTERGIVEYALEFLEWEPHKLRVVGFEVSEVKSLVNYRFVRTQQEYERVLDLRRAAYSAVGKIARDAAPASVSYDFDAYSRILTGWHRDRLVAAVTIIFGDGRDRQFEIQKLISDSEFQKLPPARTMVEVAALCIDHDYRKSDILLGLFERLFQVLVTSGRRTIIAGTDKHLWKVYQRIGFQKSGIKYRIPKYGDLEHDVILVNRRVGSYGFGLDPMSWDRVWHNISDHLSETGVLKKKWRHRVVGAIYKGIAAAIRPLKEFSENG